MACLAQNCSACIYWKSYPMMEQFGVCENQASRYCERGVPASNEACEYFAPGEAKQRKCEECHDWYPLDTMPRIGECKNPTSPRCGKAVFWNQLSGACFEERSLERMEFPWCRTCRETVPASDLDMHRGHDLFAGSSHPPVEDMMEITFAGD